MGHGWEEETRGWERKFQTREHGKQAQKQECKDACGEDDTGLGNWITACGEDYVGVRSLKKFWKRKSLLIL